MAQVKLLRVVGVLVPVGRHDRAIEYRIVESCPVNSALTGSCKQCYDKTGQRYVKVASVSCQGEVGRLVNTLRAKSSSNGNLTIYKNGNALRLKQAWANESRTRYPGVRNWEAFVTSKIQKGEMPEKHLERRQIHYTTAEEMRGKK